MKKKQPVATVDNFKEIHPECQHTPKIPRGYLAAHSEADRRIKAGQKQKQCPVCKLWWFTDEF